MGVICNFKKLEVKINRIQKNTPNCIIRCKQLSVQVLGNARKIRALAMSRSRFIRKKNTF